MEHWVLRRRRVVVHTITRLQRLLKAHTHPVVRPIVLIQRSVRGHILWRLDFHTELDHAHKVELTQLLPIGADGNRRFARLALRSLPITPARTAVAAISGASTTRRATHSTTSRSRLAATEASCPTTRRSSAATTRGSTNSRAPWRSGACVVHHAETRLIFAVEVRERVHRRTGWVGRRSCTACTTCRASRIRRGTTAVLRIRAERVPVSNASDAVTLRKRCVRYLLKLFRENRGCTGAGRRAPKLTVGRHHRQRKRRHGTKKNVTWHPTRLTTDPRLATHLHTCHHVHAQEPYVACHLHTVFGKMWSM